MPRLSFFVPPDKSVGLRTTGHSPDHDQALDTTLTQAMQVWGLLGSRAATAEALGWLSLFAKALSVLLALRGALAGRSSLALHAAQRLGYELHTHLHSILRPVAGETTALNDPRKQSLVREYLRVYAAWGIANDSRRLQTMLDSSTLDDLFEPHTAREFISTLGERRTEYERFFGEIPEDSDQELELDRKKYCANVQRALDALKALAATLGLSEAVTRVEAVKKRDAGFPSVLSELLGRGSANVTQQLHDSRVRFTRSLYSESSQHLHGSTLAIEADGSVLVPAPFARGHTIPRHVTELAVMMRDHLLRLNILVLVLPEDESRNAAQ